MAPDAVRLVDIPNSDTLLEVVVVVVVPELEVKRAPGLNGFGLRLLPYGEVGNGDGNTFGDRENEVLERLSFDLGENWAVVEGFAHR